MSAPNPPNFRESDACRSCRCSKLTDINDGVMPHIVLLCEAHENLVVQGHYVCDDYTE